MKALALSLAVCLACAGGARADGDVAAQSNVALIDSLTAIDHPVMGANGMSMDDGFIGDGGSPQLAAGVLGAPASDVTPQMRELVRRGVAAMPDLLTHLTDARPTKYVVGNTDPKSFFYSFQYFGDEYDPKVRTSLHFCAPGCGERDFATSYTVKVGDLCYALIGQIVGRYLSAVRYQPTAGLVVNSPLESKRILREIRRDWRGLTLESFRAFLLADIEGARNLQRASSALTRLRFYYPADYAALQDRSLSWREKFEAQEKAAAGNAKP